MRSRTSIGAEYCSPIRWRSARIEDDEHATRAATGIRFAERDAATIATHGDEVRVGQRERPDAQVLHLGDVRVRSARSDATASGIVPSCTHWLVLGS